MRPNSMQMSIHNRRDSTVSQHSDMGHHGGPGSNRGGFPQGGRGRGFPPPFNNSQMGGQMGGQMGYPPNQYPRGPHNQGRGGMAPQNFGGRGAMPYPNSPQPARGSPAMPHAMPGQGTPNMNPAIPVPSPHGTYAHQYGPPMSGGGYPQPVNTTPIPHERVFPFSQPKQSKKKAARRSSENRQLRQPDSSCVRPDQDFSNKPGRLSKRRGSTADFDRPYRGRDPSLDLQGPMPPPSALIAQIPVLDLTPGPDGFDRVKHLLTETKQNYGYGAPFDPNRPPFMPVPYNAPMYHPPGSPAPAPYPHQYGAPYPPPAGQPMSRNNSQMSERPASSTGNQGPMGFSAPPQPPKGPVVASTPGNQFVRPKSKAIAIRNPAGETIDLKSLKAPASPAPSIQQSKTPPVIASTPTPPPKSGTPASHTRNESASAAKAPEDIKAAFLEQVKKSREVVGSNTDDKAAVEADTKSNTGEDNVEEVPAPSEPKDVEAKPAEPTETPTKAEPEAEEKAEEVPVSEAQEETQPKVEDVKPDSAAEADEPPKETEEEYMERMIKEMEEEDARREAEQAEITKKKAVEKEAAKKKADEEAAAAAADNDRKLREQEREMERLEEEREKARARAEAQGEATTVAEQLAAQISDLTGSQKKEASSGANAAADKLSKLTINSSRDAISPGSAPSSAKSTGKERRPAALNLAPLKTGSVEAPPPSAAMQALKSARFLTIKDEIKYPVGIASPNPATNAAAAKKGGSFKYDSAFLLQFQKVFTEQPSVEFSQQVKALIGDSDGSRSASARGSGAGQVRQGSKSSGAFGAFTQPSGKPLPPGTTSDQRFAMSQGQMARPAMGGPMASFGRGSAFPGPASMARQSSGLGMSNSRTGSRNQTRGGSKPGKGYGGQNESKLAATMPLTQGLDLKPIATSSTGWKPMSLTQKSQPQPGVSGLLDPETVQRKVKAALNKMTPENFDKISEQILQIAAQSKDEQDGRTLRQVIQLTFEKATDEAHWAAMYAKFCKRMLETMSPEVKDVTITDKNGNVVSGGALFRKYLLNRCQEDFERGWNVDMPEPKEGESKETALMSDEYYKAMAVKRRGLGLVQFIGELFKLGMLTERIMHECVRKLLDFKDEPDEAEIESLTKLLRTIGANLDSTEKGNAMMNAYFERISNLVETELPSRLKFMLLDIIDLRKAKWMSKDGPKGPKTLEEVRAEVSGYIRLPHSDMLNLSYTKSSQAEAAAAAKAAEASRSNVRNQPGGRFPSGRGDARNSYGSYHGPPASSTVGMDDLRRLKGQSSRAASGSVTLGPTSMFNSRSSSGRKLGPGGALTRGNEDSGASSRTGTPPTQASANAFA